MQSLPVIWSTNRRGLIVAFGLVSFLPISLSHSLATAFQRSTFAFLAHSLIECIRRSMAFTHDLTRTSRQTLRPLPSLLRLLLLVFTSKQWQQISSRLLNMLERSSSAAATERERRKASLHSSTSIGSG